MKVPQKIEGFWKCPRCDSNEVYFAKRQIGQFGVLRDGPNAQDSIMSKSIEADVGLCKNCGERSNYTKPKYIYSDLEKLEVRKTSAKFGAMFCLPVGVSMTITSIQRYSMSNKTMANFIILGVFSTIFGIYCLVKGFRPEK